MYANWGKAARCTIAKIAEDFQPDTPWQERRKALRAGAHDFHGGTSWGKKVWSRECRRYLEQHGMPPLPALGAPRSGLQQRSKQSAKLAAPDITFPFRS